MSEEIREIRVGSRVPAGNPKVSIIIPNYKTAEFIGDTLRSVRAQTFSDFEVIVINDGAPDTEQLYDALTEFYDEITFIDKASNSGTSATRNLAATYARGEILSFLDADDIWHPTFLEEVLAFKEKNGFQMAYADAEQFESGDDKMVSLLSNNPEEGKITKDQLLQGKVHCLPSGALIDTEAFASCNGFDPAVSRCEDLELWTRFLFAGVRIGYLKKILFKFRVRPESGSGDSIQRIERGRDVWKILRSKFDFSPTELRYIENNMKYWDAAARRARGRVAIVERNWAEARTQFAQASRLANEIGLPLNHRLRILGVRALLAIHPESVRKTQMRLRKGEISYMPVEKEQPGTH